MDPFLDDLVRVVLKDGSVWWVKPSSADTYAKLGGAGVTFPPPRDDVYDRFMFGPKK